MQSRHDAELERISLDLLRAIGFRGLGGIEFKRDARDGRYKLIEFNARYGMWDSLGMRCGVDIPWAAYRDALGEPVEPQRSYRTGVKWVDLQRDARAFLEYRARGQLSFAGWLRSLLGEKDWAIFDRRDWKPTVVSAGRAGAGAAGARREPTRPGPGCFYLRCSPRLRTMSRARQMTSRKMTTGVKRSIVIT